MINNLSEQEKKDLLKQTLLENKNFVIDFVLELIMDELLETKRVVIKGFGVFELLPRRKGKVNCYLKQAQGKADPRYEWRIKFTPAKPLKEKLCK